MRHRVCASALLVVIAAACGGDGRITEPTVPPKLTGLAAIGTDATTGATIETDLNDYAPGGAINLTGRGWAPNETVHLVMTEDPDSHPDVVRDVQADANGGFTLQFYQVQESDLGVRFMLTGTGTMSGSRVEVVFTDQRNISATLLSPASPFAAGTNVTVTVQVILNSGTGPTVWNGTKWEIRNSSNVVVASSPAPCLDTPNHSVGDADTFSGNKHQESFSFTAGPAGTYSLTVAAYSTGNCADPADATSQTSNFTVSGSNASPVLAAIGNQSVNEGSTLTFTASATDSDVPAQTLTYSLVGAPAGASINSSSGAFSWTPTDGPAQTATFTVRVTDNGSPAMSDDESITVTVNNVVPTATFTAPASVAAGANINLSLTLPGDVSTVDAAAGFTYDFDCGSGYDGFTAANTAICPTSSPGSVTVKGKIRDKDNGETEYTASVAIDNVAPIANAGGPYTGNEGSPITLTGTGSDPDGGTVTYLWSVAPNDGHCTIAAPTSANTTVTCDDNGAWTLTLKVTDDETAFTTSAAALTVSNVVPTITGLSAPASVNEGQNIVFSVNGASDASTVDVAAGFTYAFSCDGSTPSSYSATNSKSCPTTDNGTVTIKGRAKDKDGGESLVASATVTVNNVAPTATFNAPLSVNEGTAINLSLTSPVDPSSADVAAGFEYAFDCGGSGGGYGAFGSSNSATCPTTDDDVRTVKGKIRDKDGGVTEYTAPVTVNNVAPQITTPLVVPILPIAAGNPVTVSWSFTDPGADTWTCKISWDQPVQFGTAFASSGKTCTASTSSLPAGIYTVTVYVADDDNGSDQETATAYIVVYDPNAGFVTGGGWIDSPAGAYRLNAALTGKANFGFVSKYQKGQTKPSGDTEFQFHAASMNFKSKDYEWLVITGTTKAQFKGTGTINGAGTYGFLLSAVDGDNFGAKKPDTFRIKIWDVATGDVVYDNNFGTDEVADPTTVVAGGSIQIKAK